MNIYLGNLTIRQLEDRCGCKFEEEDYKWLKEHRQDNAEIKTKDKLHIFDIPFMIQTGEDISKVKNREKNWTTIDGILANLEAYYRIGKMSISEIVENIL